jgi:cytidine deaminase
MPKDLLPRLDGPEIVIGLAAPIGVDTKEIGKRLTKELRKFRYNSSYIRVTDSLPSLRLGVDLQEKPADKRYHSYMDAGNWLREKLDLNDAFAFLACAAVAERRSEINHRTGTIKPREAYIISQFKRPEEIRLMRRIYGQHFVLISIQFPRQKRVDHIASTIADSYHRRGQIEKFRGKAEELIARDEEEEEKPSGQRLRDTFSLGDLAIADDGDASVDGAISRFMQAFFDSPFVTPTKDELFQCIARVVALKSADLSRQVGAVLVSEGDHIIGVGCNDVPKAGGGLYWENDQFDGRDFKRGYDSNVRIRDNIVADLLKRLSADWLKAPLRKQDPDTLMRKALYEDTNPVLKEALVTDLLEYGRIVHAEMAALADANRLGKTTTNSTLYCTTFPCHNCARQIIASGVKRVVYVEPYPKSLAPSLYSDSILFDGYAPTPGAKVKFEPFVGVSPNRFREIFARGRRKGPDGALREWTAAEAQPIIESFFAGYRILEAQAIEGLEAELRAKGLKA